MDGAVSHVVMQMFNPWLYLLWLLLTMAILTMAILTMATTYYGVRRDADVEASAEVEVLGLGVFRG